MLRWPIRLKLIVSLGLVVGMMLILMGASIFGLHSFHTSYLTLVDQLRELGASAKLIESVFRMHPPRDSASESEREELKRQVVVAQDALHIYFRQLKQNTRQGSRVDQGLDELGVAFLMDDDLAAIRAELDPDADPPKTLLPGTSYYVANHPELLPQVKPATGLKVSHRTAA